MTRYRHFIGISVVEAARKRLHETFDTFDHVAVMFSGGKDSLVCLELARQVMRERGETGKLHVVFRDEEVIPPQVAEFVERYRHVEDLDLLWLAIPMSGMKAVLGIVDEVVWWDPSRPWVRERPAWAETEGPGRTMTQYELDGWIYKRLGFTGSAAFVTGIRTAESLPRYRSVVNKLSRSYVVATHAGDHVSLVRPIYDWQENDVFKWLHENGVAWCDYYETCNLAHSRLRVSTPMHGGSISQAHLLAAQDAAYWDRILEVFPEMALNARYYRDYDFGAAITKYAEHGMAGIYAWIRDNMPPGPKRDTCTKLAGTFATLHARQPKAYPITLFLKHVARGNTWKLPTALKKHEQAP